MSYCKCCYRKLDANIDFCLECSEKINSGERIYLKETCPICYLHWYGYYAPDQGLKSHTKLRCDQVKTGKIDPNRNEGKVPLRCSNCGTEGWVTKNIGYVGAREIFWMGEIGVECDCSGKYLEPILLEENDERYVGKRIYY